MLKLDFHLHTNQDPYDTWIKHSPYQLIDKAHVLGFDVLCLSHHGRIIFKKEWQSYAKKKNILLLPGTEAFVERKHILLINFTQKELNTVKTFNDLKRFKDDTHLIIASHPFFPSPECSSMGTKIHSHFDCVDALEYNSYYIKGFNWNKKGKRVARQYHLPLVANTDCHNLKEFGKTYTLVKAKKNVKEIFKAIKKNNLKIVSRPHTLSEFITRTIETILIGGSQYLKNKGVTLIKSLGK